MRLSYFLRSFGMVILLAVLRVTPAVAQGTALSNSRDLLRLDILGGLAAPSPGISAGVGALWTARPADAFGISLDTSMHNDFADDTKLFTRAYDLVWEHSWSLLGGFHALRIRGGAGAAHVQRTMDERVAREKGRDPDQITLAGHVSGSVALDLPIADLIWVRLGARTEKALLRDAPVQGGVFVAGVFGGQWLGIGD